MRTYRLSSRPTNAASYWLQARNDRDARRFVALNVPGANRATEVTDFCCVMDSSKAPPAGFIDCGEGKLVPIVRL
jgi:hypothetical protein